MDIVLPGWGVGADVRSCGVEFDKVEILRWQNGAKLSVSDIDHRYGQQLVVHRADLHMALLRAAQRIPSVTIRENSPVIDVDFEKPSVLLANGEVISGDVLLAADGIKSSIRGKLLGDASDPAVPTGDAVFRLVLDRACLASDPSLRHYIEGNTIKRWIGPGRHVVAYPVKNHQAYNIVMPHPDRGGLEEAWTKPGSKADMLKEFEGWHQDLVKMLQLAPDEEVLAWKLCSHQPLRTWTNKSCALLGDACHAMLPYVAQGAAQAVEDAAALGIVLSSISSVSQVPFALKVYEKARKSRAEMVQSQGQGNRATLHLDDGVEQEARDRLFSCGESPDRWMNRETQQLLWDYDAEETALRLWNGMTTNPKITRFYDSMKADESPKAVYARSGAPRRERAML
ncbi:hypothetical protein ACJ41O_012344 [Fusarium nematophilum]